MFPYVLYPSYFVHYAFQIPCKTSFLVPGSVFLVQLRKYQFCRWRRTISYFASTLSSFFPLHVFRNMAKVTPCNLFYFIALHFIAIDIWNFFCFTSIYYLFLFQSFSTFYPCLGLSVPSLSPWSVTPASLFASVGLSYRTSGGGRTKNSVEVVSSQKKIPQH